MVSVEGRRFTMGTDDEEGYPDDGEGPARPVEVSSFWLGTTTVTNAQFARFVDSCSYVTEAERWGWSFVFAGLLPEDFAPTRGMVDAPWWRQVHGACWRHPEGPGSDLELRMDHPVVHVSWHDAQAYCAWSGTRLPSEAEWELAARGGLEGCRFPWGDELNPSGQHMCNIWQGSFPEHNSVEDGYYGTAPADAFAPNAFGLYNMVGNVWEWCEDRFDPAGGPLRAMRGGSYLCHRSYCYRYRVTARSFNQPGASAGNLGFRVASSELARSTASITPGG